MHDLPDIVRAAGLDVRCWPGWETRSRSSGGYDAFDAVFVHHTASSADPDDDCAYMWDNADDRPIGAVLLERTGRVTIGAAGATNCQGKGGPWHASAGTIPVDRGNSYGLAVEAANNGVGEPWPTVQQDAYVTLCKAVCDAYGLDPARDVCAHAEWAPDRKVDPAGPSRWATGTATWDMDGFRDAVAELNGGDEVTDDDIERIAQRAAELVWAEQFSTVDHGVKAAGWILAQDYTMTQRAVKAAEEAAANTRG